MYEVWIQAQWFNLSDSVISNLLDMAKEVSTKRLHVGFIGIMKAGKSTTLNALLQKRVLPSAVQAETALEVVIKHDPHSLDGLLLGELNSTNESEAIADGSDIHDAILRLSKQRRDQGWNKYSRLVLSISIPFLSKGTNDIALTISDTPGSDEAVIRDLDLDKSIQHLAAYVVVLDYRKMKGEAEISLLNNLRKHHATILNTPERLLFVINYMNMYHEHKALRDENSLPPHEAPSYVSKYLEQLLGIKVSADQVIPYSAYWALHGRLCLSDPKHMNKRLLQEAELVLSSFHSGHSDVNTTCKRLVEYSNILLIEERMLDRFVQYGHKVIEKNAAEKTVQLLCSLLNTYEQQIWPLTKTKSDLEENVKVQKQKFTVVEQIIIDVPAEIAASAQEICSLVATDVSVDLKQKVAKMVNESLDDIEAVVYKNNAEVNDSVLKIATLFCKKGSDLVNMVINNGFRNYRQRLVDTLESAVSGILQKLDPLMGKEAWTYHFVSAILDSSELLEHVCDIAPIVHIQNYTEEYIKQHPSIRAFKVEEEFSMWLINPGYYTNCGYQVKEKRDDFYTVKALPLNRKLEQYIQSCYPKGESKLTLQMRNISKSVSKEFQDHLQLWWQERAHAHSEILKKMETDLEEVNQKLSGLKKKQLILLELSEVLKTITRQQF